VRVLLCFGQRAIGGSEHDVDLSPAGKTDPPGGLVLDPVGDDLGAARGEDVASALRQVGLDATSGD
jgi:hypothetical protein